MDTQGDFEVLMGCGEAALGKGDYMAAIEQFHALTASTVDTVQRCRAMQQLGIALRLNGDPDGAKRVFCAALGYAPEGSTLPGRIKRDLGMVWFDLGDYTTAVELFEQSQADLWNAGDVLEAYVSEGFKGRAYLYKGDRKLAIATLLIVHKKLRSEPNRVYELNNLMWLALASQRYRWAYAPRALVLIHQSGHTRRLPQYAGLLAGFGHYYDCVR